MPGASEVAKNGVALKGRGSPNIFWSCFFFRLGRGPRVPNSYHGVLEGMSPQFHKTLVSSKDLRVGGPLEIVRGVTLGIKARRCTCM